MRTELLDHGYIELVETWGSDERIIEAARMSTNKGFLGWGPRHTDDCEEHFDRHSFRSTHGEKACICEPKPGDEKLLHYLYTHGHMTPFEMAGMIIEVQAPIFVFREWHRHRTQSYNELSARYTPIPDVNYIPDLERILMSGGTNKQATGIGGLLTRPGAAGFQVMLKTQYEVAEALYQAALRDNIPKELARLCIPVGRYSRMRASANLRNWLAFLTLRMDTAAQWEIRQYANAVATVVEAKFPRTYELFAAGR